MLKRTLILLTVVIAQTGCTFYEEHGFYKPGSFGPDSVRYYEGLKRQYLQLEDLTVGHGPVAAAGRKVTAQIAVRYSDGTLVYEGPAVTYWGMIGGTFIHNNVQERGLLSTQQLGLVWGLNGMAVGGKRRMVIAPNAVCYEGAAGESLGKGG